MPTPGGQEFTEQPIKSPELVLEGMRTDRMSGNAGSFLAGVLELDQLKATKEYATEIQKLGHERSIWRQVSDGLKEADLEGDKKSVSAYLRLGGLLGINEDPELAMQLDEMRGIYSLPTLPKEAEEDARNADVEALVKVFGRNDSGVLVLPEEAVEEIKPGRKLTSKEKTQLNEDIKYYLGIDRMRKEMPDKPDELQSLQEAYLAVVDKFKENIDQRFNKSGEKKQVLNYEIANAVNAVNAEYDYDPEIDGYDLIAGVTRKLQEALEEDTDLSNEVLLRVSKTKIFGGQKLNDFVNSNAIL